MRDINFAVCYRGYGRSGFFICLGIHVFFIFSSRRHAGPACEIAPSAGGITAYVQLAFQKKAGAILGWIMLGSVPIGVPIIALTGAHYVSYITEAADWQITLIAGCMLAISILLHMRGIQLSANISTLVICVIATRHASRIQTVSSAWLVCRGICFCYDFFLFCRLGNDYPIG